MLTTDCAALEIVSFMNVFVRREEVVHDNEVDFPSPWELDTTETIEAR